jgi:hypothetical protein
VIRGQILLLRSRSGARFPGKKPEKRGQSNEFKKMEIFNGQFAIRVNPVHLWFPSFVSNPMAGFCFILSR